MGILDALAKVPATVLKATLNQTVVYRTYERGGYDPATGKNTRVPTDASVLALAEDYPALLTASGANAEEGIRRGDKRVTIPASELTRIGVSAPAPGHEVKIGGVWYGVKSFDADPGPIQPLTWVLQVRR